jgi:hypothetical protein
VEVDWVMVEVGLAMDTLRVTTCQVVPPVDMEVPLPGMVVGEPGMARQLDTEGADIEVTSNGTVPARVTMTGSLVPNGHGISILFAIFFYHFSSFSQAFLGSQILVGGCLV